MAFTYIETWLFLPLYPWQYPATYFWNDQVSLVFGSLNSAAFSLSIQLLPIENKSEYTT